MKVKVECHAGYAYPERPTALYIKNDRFDIKQTAAEWRTLRGKHFRVKLSDEREIELIYHEDLNEWEAIGLV